jgi:hypothetical protein
MIIELELLIWVTGILLGYSVRRTDAEVAIVYLVGFGVGIGTLAAALSGELFENLPLLPFDIIQGFLATLAGFYVLPRLLQSIDPDRQGFWIACAVVAAAVLVAMLLGLKYTLAY